MPKLTGAYIELYKVTDPDGADTEELIAETRDDVDIDWNVETRETKIHGSSTVYKAPTHWAPVVGFQGLLVSTIDAWTTLGFKKAGGASNGDDLLRPFPEDCAIDALRFKVYEKDADTTPKQTVTCIDTVVKLNTASWPNEDFAFWEAECDVRGEVRMVES